MALSLLAMPALIFFEWRYWHPGWARVDEISVFETCLHWMKGTGADVRAGGGSLHHFLLVLLSEGLGPSLSSLHLLQSASLLAESLLLFNFVKRLAGEKAAAWALLSSTLCAFTLMRGRSLLSYSLLPLELLLLESLYRRLPSAPGRLVWGLFLALLTLDYELWFFGAALAACFAAFAPGAKRQKIAAGLGLGLGLAWVAWISRDSLQSYAAVRLAKSAPGGRLEALQALALHLKAYFLGGPAFPYIAPAGHPVFPAWAWPGLALGCLAAWKKSRWILAWILASFLPLAFRSPGLEPQRAMLAWPALCACAGMGLAWLSARLGRLAPLLLLLPLAGFAFELKAHARSMEASWAGIYGPSQAQIMAANAIQASGKPALLNLDLHTSAPARYLLSAGPQERGQALALIPWYDLPALKSETGALETLADPLSGSQAWIFSPSGPSAARMLERDAKLGWLWDRLPARDRFARVAMLQALLRDPGWRDPWLRSVLWSETLEGLHYLGRLEDKDIEALLAERLPTAEPYRETALREGRRRPALGIRLMERAAEIDPRLPFTPELRAPLEYYLALEQRAQPR